jgi:hypothetical protein
MMMNSHKSLSPIAILFAALFPISVTATAAPPPDPGNGQLYQSGEETLAWSGISQQWLPVVDFWLEYAPTAQGKFWGRSAQYPKYEDVNEHDTLLIQVQQGPCLMYFFHNRWRRAQDVRRWDPDFNDLLGCPNVFD